MPREPKEFVEYTKVSVQVTREFNDRWLVACGQEFKAADKLRQLMSDFIEMREQQKEQLKQIIREQRC
jgi:hypothetical protein